MTMDLTRPWRSRSNILIFIGMIIVLLIDSQSQQKTQLMVYEQKYNQINNNNFDNIFSNPNDSPEKFVEDFVSSGDDQHNGLDETQYFIHNEDTNDDTEDDDDKDVDEDNLLGDISDNSLVFDVADLDDSLGDSTMYGSDSGYNNDNDNDGEVLGSDFEDYDEELTDDEEPEEEFDNQNLEYSYDPEEEFDNQNLEYSDDPEVSEYYDNQDSKEVYEYEDSGIDNDEKQYYYENESNDLDDTEYFVINNDNKKTNSRSMNVESYDEGVYEEEDYDDDGLLSSRRSRRHRKHPKRRRKRTKKRRYESRSLNLNSRRPQIPPMHPKKRKALKRFVAKINSMQSSWTAGMNHVLAMHTKHVKSLMTCHHMNRKRHRRLPTLHHVLSADGDKIPETFDARKQWPDCANVIDYIRNQGQCGCCWSESVAGSASDRLCITSGGGTIISAIDLQCCTECAPNGYCMGGDPIKAWQYFKSNGLVTGGDQSGGCKPWTISLAQSSCVAKCTNDGFGKSYKEDLHFGTSAYQVGASEEQIMAEVMKHGSVAVAMAVYSDFMAYKSGVYKPMSTKLMGYHAIRLMGWGTEGGVKYWLIANSWSKNWGLSGYFKMARDGDPCGVMDYVTAGIPAAVDDPVSGIVNSSSTLLTLLLPIIIFLIYY